MYVIQLILLVYQTQYIWICYMRLWLIWVKTSKCQGSLILWRPKFVIILNKIFIATMFAPHNLRCNNVCRTYSMSASAFHKYVRNISRVIKKMVLRWKGYFVTARTCKWWYVRPPLWPVAETWMMRDDRSPRRKPVETYDPGALTTDHEGWLRHSMNQFIMLHK